MQRANSLEKILMLGKIEGRRRKEPQTMQPFDGITDSMDMSLSKLWELVMDRELTQTHVHQVSDAIQPSHPLLPPYPPTLSFPQHQDLFQ